MRQIELSMSEKIKLQLHPKGRDCTWHQLGVQQRKIGSKGRCKLNMTKLRWAYLQRRGAWEGGVMMSPAQHLCKQEGKSCQRRSSKQWPNFWNTRSTSGKNKVEATIDTKQPNCPKTCKMAASGGIYISFCTPGHKSKDWAHQGSCQGWTLWPVSVEIVGTSGLFNLPTEHKHCTITLSPTSTD